MIIRKTLRNSLIASALIAGVIGLTAAPAQAMPRDACQDAYNLAAANSSTSMGYAQLSMSMYNLGYYELSQDYADAAAFYALAAETVIRDSGC